jgi:hypothetical protein
MRNFRSGTLPVIGEPEITHRERARCGCVQRLSQVRSTIQERRLSQSLLDTLDESCGLREGHHRIGALSVLLKIETDKFIIAGLDRVEIGVGLAGTVSSAAEMIAAHRSPALRACSFREL